MKRKITDKTIQYTMRIVGSMILISAVALIVYLVWVTSKIGIDASLFLYFSVGIISAIVTAVMIYFSFKISFEEERAVETEVVHRKEEPHAIIEAYREHLIDIIKPFQEPGSQLRAARKIKHFIGLSYPELTNVNWEEEVAKLFG